MKRIVWLDQLKGLAVGIGIWFYLLPMLMSDLNPQLNLSGAGEWFRNLHFYLPLGLVLISGFSIYFTETVDRKWWLRKFFSLVVLSSGFI
jgi:hypothetical protein